MFDRAIALIPSDNAMARNPFPNGPFGQPDMDVVAENQMANNVRYYLTHGITAERLQEIFNDALKRAALSEA